MMVTVAVRGRDWPQRLEEDKERVGDALENRVAIRDDTLMETQWYLQVKLMNVIINTLEFSLHSNFSSENFQLQVYSSTHISLFIMNNYSFVQI